MMAYTKPAKEERRKRNAKRRRDQIKFIDLKADFHPFKSERAGEKRNVEDVLHMRVGSTASNTTRMTVKLF